MKLFGAKLQITSASPVQGFPDTWEIVGRIIDASGKFTTSDIKVGNIVYAYSLNEAEEKIMIRYKVSKLNSINAAGLDINITWDDEDTTNYLAPQLDYESIIGEQLRGSSMAISEMSNSVSIDTIIDARNMDEKKSTFLDKIDEIDGGTF